MNFVAVFMAVFAMLGAIDCIIGNRFGLGKEFEKGFYMLGNLALSMIGMIIISPFIGTVFEPVFNLVYDVFGIDSSVLPAMLLANDMGGASLSTAVAQSEEWGNFNGLVVSSMMGCTLSFTIPVVLNIVEEKLHKYVLLGLLCGIVTIPLGCAAAGLLLGLDLWALLMNTLPLIVFSLLIGCGLLWKPQLSVKILSVFGKIIKLLVVIGLALGVLKFLTGVELIDNLGTFEEGAFICFNAAAVMSGAFPFILIVSKVLSKPLKMLSKRLDINEVSALGFLSTLATSLTTFESMKDMDKKGLVLNSAFAVSAGFTFAGHLAFTMSYNTDYIFYVTIGKLIAGVSALLVAMVVYKRVKL